MTEHEATSFSVWQRERRSQPLALATPGRSHKGEVDSTALAFAGGRVFLETAQPHFLMQQDPRSLLPSLLPSLHCLPYPTPL